VLFHIQTRLYSGRDQTSEYPSDIQTTDILLATYDYLRAAKVIEARLETIPLTRNRLYHHKYFYIAQAIVETDFDKTFPTRACVNP
jgi:hypothetical protein